MKKIASLLILLSFGIALKAVTAFPAPITFSKIPPSTESLPLQISVSLLHLHFDKATRMAEQEKKPAVKAYYLTRILFYRYLLSESRTYRDEFMRGVKVGLSALEKMARDEPVAHVMGAELLFLRGVVRLLNGQSVPAAFDMSNACKKLLEGEASPEGKREAKKLKGLLMVALSTVPRRLQWIGNLFCFKGNLKKGLRELELASQESVFLAEEATILLFYIEKNLLGDSNAAIKRIKALNQRYAGGFVPRFLLSQAWVEAGDNDKALAIFKKDEPLFEQDPDLELPPIWFYSRARSHYYKLELEAAIRYFDRFLDGYQGKNMRPDAMFRKGISLLILGRNEEGQKVLNALTGTGEARLDQDDYAFAMASRYGNQLPSAAQLKLFKARNLFDGGYYQEALAVLPGAGSLEGNAGTNLEEKTELNYRLGRIYSKIGEQGKAIVHLTRCTGFRPRMNLWMSAYSHYYLGKMIEENSPGEALKHYREALKFQEIYYQSGLEQKCKAAISNLKASGK